MTESVARPFAQFFARPGLAVGGQSVTEIVWEADDGPNASFTSVRSLLTHHAPRPHAQ